ncbi:CCG-binding protein 1-like [Neltuma alba]|uniref:CCG-binding protein 1 n=1 Tax=Neltuma alba TaxID=207710 RepID=UPI0010A597AF|nr:CCG-binding protein 1 [Prosopis alba]XP_028775996.1 CCG-binding protein 1-like [Prosopis alba]
MIKSALLRSCSSPLLLDPKPSSSSTRFATSTISCSSRNQAYIPKLEPFSRSKFERAVKEPPLIQKSEIELADYCSTLEGEESYGCWQAYFELKDLEKEIPKADVERLILQTGGVKSLIGCLHGIAYMHKLKKNGLSVPKLVESEERQRQCPIPDGLPKSEEEMMEEEDGRLPDSPFTRLLRSKGRFPAWYSQAPDHQTD